MFRQINLHKCTALFLTSHRNSHPAVKDNRSSDSRFYNETEMQWLHSQLLHKWLDNKSCFYEQFDFDEHCKKTLDQQHREKGFHKRKCMCETTTVTLPDPTA